MHLPTYISCQSYRNTIQLLCFLIVHNQTLEHQAEHLLIMEMVNPQDFKWENVRTVILLSILNVLPRISVNSIQCPNLIHKHWDLLRPRSIRPIFIYTDHLCQSPSSKFGLLEAGHKSIKMSRQFPTLGTSFKLSRISTIYFFLISSFHSSLL